MGFVFVALFAMLAAFDRPIPRGRQASKSTPEADPATGTGGA
jgi:hypothetical protein